jgi:hypothetical protein
MTNDVSRRVEGIVAEGLATVFGAVAWAWAWRADLAWSERHVAIDHFALDDDAAAVARIWRIFALGVGLVMIVLVRPALGRWVRRVGAREALLASGRIVIALLLALVTSEGALAYARSHAHRVDPLKTEDRIGQPDPRYGWVWQPSRATVLRTAGRTIEYAINADRDRARSVNDVPDPALPTVLIAGESIGAGHGLPWNDTFPALVGDALGIQVVTLAVHGYGSDQAFLRLVDELPRFDRPVALVTVFMPCMMWRMTRSDHPHVSLDGDSLTVFPPLKTWRDLALGDLWLHRVRYDSDAAVTQAAALFRQTARLAAARGAKVLFVRPYYGARESDPLVDELFTRQGIPCVTVDVGADVLPYDHHPDAKATRRIADAIASALALGGA